MTDDSKAIVPVWTLATRDARLPALAGDGPMTAERLAELRSALAGLSDSPIATLEAHPLPDTFAGSRGIPLDAASPLAQHLSQLIMQTRGGSSVAATVVTTGEGLFRMVVPAKVAAQLGQGVVRSMSASKVAAGGVYSGLVDSTGRLVDQVAFVPVREAAAAGAIGGAGATAGATVASSAALTVAAPLVLMAIAVGVSAHADYRRQQAVEHITELLEQLKDEQLGRERNDLDGCRDAIDKATAILLDQGKLGVSLGLDSAVHAISTALVAADRRLAKWHSALDKLPDGKAVEIDKLTKSFPGVDEEGGTFRTHLELAALAIALKRRVIVLQAIEHAQADPDNLFENFARELRSDQQRVEKLESGIAGVLERLSGLELTGSHGFLPVFSAGDVDSLMRAAHRIHRLGDGVMADGRTTDVAIEIARKRDGSIVVLPALPA